VWVRDLNSTQTLLKYSPRNGVDGSLLPKPSKSPDVEHAPVQPLIRKFQVSRQNLGIAVPPTVFSTAWENILFFRYQNLKNRRLLRLIHAVGLLPSVSPIKSQGPIGLWQKLGYSWLRAPGDWSEPG
jgi:hypothetical protein